jgi:hypothetical protein
MHIIYHSTQCVFLLVNVEIPNNYQLLEILLNLHAAHEVTAIFDEVKINFTNNPPSIIQTAAVCST